MNYDKLYDLVSQFEKAAQTETPAIADDQMSAYISGISDVSADDSKPLRIEIRSILKGVNSTLKQLPKEDLVRLRNYLKKIVQY